MIQEIASVSTARLNPSVTTLLNPQNLLSAIHVLKRKPMFPEELLLVQPQSSSVSWVRIHCNDQKWQPMILY